MSSTARHSKAAFVVAAPQSGSGKTTVSLALMAALKQRGLAVQPFKVGPDFIDPGFHAQVTGVTSPNLDGWMLSRAYNISRFQSLTTAADVAVVEGVMGLFDGYDGLSEAGSTAQMAKWLGIPVLLLVDARSMARSAAALLHGFTRFDPELSFAGVLFNRVGSPGHLEYLKQAVQQNLPGIRVLGGIPRDARLQIPERHLGLVTADEILLNPERLRYLAEIIDRHVDLDRLLERSAGKFNAAAAPEPVAGAAGTIPVPIAVARDEAFCFYYPDNLELLKAYGARLIFFSPLAGEPLPASAAALYLGGGYPEVHAERLSGNSGFFDGVRDAVARGLPVYAECGGLMTLGRFLETGSGRRYPMAGILPFGTRMLKRRKALGYTEVVLRSPTPIGDPGLRIRGHEFHYSEIIEPDATIALESAYEIRARKHRENLREGYLLGSVLASYVHLHWGSAPEAAACFVHRARRWNEREAGPWNQ